MKSAFIPSPMLPCSSAADRLKAQSTLPSDRTINASPLADTDIDVPVHSIGREEVPAEVVHQTDDMRRLR